MYIGECKNAFSLVVSAPRLGLCAHAMWWALVCYAVDPANIPLLLQLEATTCSSRDIKGLGGWKEDKRLETALVCVCSLNVSFSVPEYATPGVTRDSLFGLPSAGFSFKKPYEIDMPCRVVTTVGRYHNCVESLLISTRDNSTPFTS